MLTRIALILAAFSAPSFAQATSVDLAGPPVKVALRAWYNPNLETRWNMIPGMIGQLTLLQTMLLAAMSVAREREQGTFDQLLVTPLRPFEVLAGKALPGFIIGLVEATAIASVAVLWFRIPLLRSRYRRWVHIRHPFSCVASSAASSWEPQ